MILYTKVKLFMQNSNLQQIYDKKYNYDDRVDCVNDADLISMSKNEGSWFTWYQFILRRREILKHLPQPGSKIMEFGCGDGIVLGSVVKLYEVWGCDLSALACKKAKERGYTKTFQINFDDHRQQSELPSKYFDCVICSEVVEHVADTLHLIILAYNILRPGGILVITTPNAFSLNGRVRAVLGRSNFFFDPYLEVGNAHLRLFSILTLEQLVCKGKFTIKKRYTGPLQIPLLSKKYGWCNITNKFLCQNIGTQIFMICKKP